MKNKLVLLGMVLLLTACGENTQTPNITEPEATEQADILDIAEETDAEVSIIETPNIQVEQNNVDTSEEVEPLDILDEINIEAGTEKVDEEMLFRSYEGQNVTILYDLTEDELRSAGKSFYIPVKYKGQDVLVKANIVDTLTPVITQIKKLSAREGDTVSYKKAVEITDNSNNVSLEVDTSAVDLNKIGTYAVTYTATDSFQNSTTLETTITISKKVRKTEEDIKELAMKVIDKEVDKNDSKFDQARALYKWVVKHVTYSHSSGDRSSIWAGAYEGLYDHYGDCYAFYATYSVLLTYAGIDNECVARVDGKTNHWWNLVNTGDGWYHCDSSPRRYGDGYDCFMQTDDQIAAYTEAYPEKPNYYTFDPDSVPERATKIIFGDKPEKIYEKYNTEALYGD